MTRAEVFVHILAKNKIISRELAEGLLERIAEAPHPIPADVFAARLVQKGILTKAIADNILRQLGSAAHGRVERGSLSIPKGLEKTAPIDPLRPSSNSPDFSGQSSPFEDSVHSPGPSGVARGMQDVSVEPDPLVSLVSGESLNQHVKFERKKTKFKKTSNSFWESKLIYFGGTGIFALLLLAVILYFAIYRRGAEEYLNAANAARDSGNYSEAIKEYTDYLNFFPNHSGVPEATIRLSLSKMRLITDQRSDWAGALSVSKEEIAKIVLEPDYRKEAQPEFTAILPTIAENLAEKAKDTKDENDLRGAEEAMELIQKHVPLSSQPLERLRKIQVNIDFTYREREKDERLSSVLVEVKREVENANIQGAYEIASTLLLQYPGIPSDLRYRNLLSLISSGEKAAIRFVSQPFNMEVPGEDAKSESDHNLIILAHRKEERVPATRSERTLFVYASGCVFALRSTDGAVLWKKSIGGSQFTTGPFPVVHPLPVQGDKEEALMVDLRSWELIRLDCKTGRIHFRCKIGEPFRLAQIPSNRAVSHLYLSTESGKLFRIDVNTGKAEGFLHFPQKLETAPGIDWEKQQILQIAHRTTLYLLPMNIDSHTEVQSLFLGHLPRTVRIAPFFFGPYLIVVKKTDPGNSVLMVYDRENPTTHSAADPEIEGAEGETDSPATIPGALEPIQSISLRGVADTDPVLEGKRLFLATDSGGVYLFLLETDAKEPIKLVAQGTRSDAPGTEEENRNDTKTVEIRGQNRFLGLFDQYLWVAGQELISYDIQQSRSRLVPQKVLDPLTRTISPLRRIENTMFRSFQYRGQSGVAVKAVSISNGNTFWETMLADPLATEPEIDPETNMIKAITRTGKMYRFPFPGALQEPQIIDRPTADLLGEKKGTQIGSVVPLPGGFEAWIDLDTSDRSLPIYDANPDNPRQFRSIPLPYALQVEPIALDQGLLAPLSNGQVYFYDPKSGTPLADPFVVNIGPSRASQWTKPVLIEKEGTAQNPRRDFLILDRSQSTLYRVEAVKSKNRTQLQVVDKLAEIAPQSDVLSALGPTAAVFNMNAGFVQEVNWERMQFGRTYEPGFPIVWGPHRTPDRILFADSQGRIYSLSLGEENGFTLKSTEAPGFPIQGKPFFEAGKIFLNSLDGTFWSMDPETLECTILKKSETAPHNGPILYENTLITSGTDGCLHLETLGE